MKNRRRGLTPLDAGAAFPLISDVICSTATTKDTLMLRRLQIALVLLAVLPAFAWAGDNNKPLSRIAFGSCAHQDRPQPIWEQVVAVKPDLFLFAGDNIYGDTRDMEVLKARYARLAAMPGYQKLLRICPLLATWDDHDYGADDAGADSPNRAGCKQLFSDSSGTPKASPRRRLEGVYHAEVFGPPDGRVQVILLATRYPPSPLKKRRCRAAPGRMCPT